MLLQSMEFMEMNQVLKLEGHGYGEEQKFHKNGYKLM